MIIIDKLLSLYTMSIICMKALCKYFYIQLLTLNFYVMR